MEHLSKSVPVSFSCAYFGVSRSGYYNWKDTHQDSGERQRRLAREIKEEFEKSRGTYGSPRICRALLKRGVACSENTVAGIMRREGLSAARRKKRFVKTTDSNHNGPVAPRLFKTEGSLPKELNKVWAGDITYIEVAPYLFLYLSVVLDLCNREVIGWSLDETLHATGICKALKNALTKRKADAKVVFHSDRGSQYASKQYRDLLENHDMVPSMSRKGNCFDNAHVESFFSTMKGELEKMGVKLTKENALSEIFQYIEVFYNRKRMHSSLGYASPVEFAS